MVDVNLLETMFQLMGALPATYAATGVQQERLGSGLPYSVPRGTYRCADGRYIAVSASSDSVAARVMALLGVGDDERFRTFAGRTAHRAELEAIMVGWCLTRTRDEVIAAFEAADAAVGPVLDMAEIATDPHYLARGILQRVGDVVMQGPIARLSATPAELRHAGRALDADGDEVRRSGWGSA